MTREQRTIALSDLGFKHNGKEMFTDTISLHWDFIVSLKDEEFDDLLITIKKHLKKKEYENSYY